MKLFKTALLILLSGIVIFAQENAEKSAKSEQKDRPLKITYKPRAEYPKSDTIICATGVMRLRIEFLANEQIGRINVVSEMPYGLTESAIAAAQKMKFESEIKKGKSITVFKTVEFSFSIY